MRVEFHHAKGMTKFLKERVQFEDDGQVKIVEDYYGGRMLKVWPDNFTRFPQRAIEDYRNKYEGKEIWVVGTGPSLDEYPDNFLDDKISIAVNFAFLAFPHCTFCHFLDRIVLNKIIDKYPEVLEKSITQTAYYKEIKHLKIQPIYMDVFSSLRERETFEQSFTRVAPDIIQGKMCPLALNTTSADTAVEIALILGAKKITMIGCEAKSGKYRGHAQKRGLEWLENNPSGYIFPEEWQKGEASGYARMREGQKIMANILNNYGIKLRKYYYKTGYEEIT